jgi:flagellum-specific peptidoglycan hydrolase FlgJ
MKKHYLFLFLGIYLLALFIPIYSAKAETNKKNTVDYLRQDILYYDPVDVNCKENPDDINDSVPAPETENLRQFTKAYAQAAINIGNEYKIPPVAIIAQAALESGNGASRLTTEAYNFFGIKADSSWKGPVWTGGTSEEYNGQTVNITAAFRKYANAEEGFKGYGEFIHDNPRYKQALKYPNDPVKYITEIKKAGYATAGNYISVNLSLQKTVKKILKDLNIDIKNTTDSGDGNLPNPNSPKTKIWSFFSDKGLSSTQIAALMGNIEAESGYNPDSTNTSSGAYGLAQWLGPRKTNLENFANKPKNKDKSKLEVQLDFMWEEELNEGYKASTLIPLKKSESLGDGVEIVLKKYEGPCGNDNNCWKTEKENRVKLAQKVLDEYGDGKAVDDTYNQDGCQNQSIPTSPLGGYGYDIKSSTKKMQYYSQTDRKWKNEIYSSKNPPDKTQTIGSSGCGVVSLSMVIETLTDKKFGPVDSAKWAVENGYRTADAGTSPNAFAAAADKFNLNARDIGSDFSAAQKALKKGGLVIASVGPGTFTTQGHYLVIRKYDNEKYYLADPNSKDGITKGESNVKGYTEEDLMSSGKLQNMWSFTK